MRNSKMNMSTSKMSTKYIDDCCMEHEGQPFVNFCTAMTCVKPLCSECIENHYTYHKNLKTPPQIISFKSLKNHCVTKIGEILQHVGAEENDLSMNELGDIFESSMKKIRETRDHSRKILDSYFHNLEDFVRKRMERMLSDQSDLFRELDKVTTIVSELKMLCNRLENPKTFISNAETIVKLDSDKIEEKVKQGYLTINNLKEQHRVNLHLQKGYEQKMVSFLSKMIYYGNFENMENMPKVAEELISKSHWENLSRSRSRSMEKEKMISSSYDNEEGSDTMYKSKPQHQSKSRNDRSLSRQDSRDDDRKSTMTRKSSSKSIKGSKKQILGVNTFKESAPRKFLHFFQNDENILHYLDLQEAQSFQPIEVNINFKIPDFHKSIATPNGEIYIIGGSLGDNGIKSQKIHRYDFKNNTLVYCASLKNGRSSHSVCFNNRYIYVLGGFMNNQELTNRCERFDISTNKVQEIRPMNYEACSFACCSFNGRYIFKIGGADQRNEITHQIEMYDEKTGEWTLVNPNVELVKGQNLVPLSTSAAVQITQTEMMIMGGYDESSVGHKQTFILRMDEEGFTIKDVNAYPLPFAEGFWNNTPILYKKHVFVLQNISYNNDECSENERRILIFDGLGWKLLG